MARNTRFLLKVKDDCGESGVVFCDLPHVKDGATGKFLLTQMASVAELEAGLISERTKAALQAAKARGQVLGCRNKKIAAYAKQGATASASVRSEKAVKRAKDVLPFIKEIQAQAEGALSLRQIASALNERNIPTARGRSWSAVQVQRLMDR